MSGDCCQNSMDFHSTRGGKLLDCAITLCVNTSYSLSRMRYVYRVQRSCRSYSGSPYGHIRLGWYRLFVSYVINYYFGFLFLMCVIQSSFSTDIMEFFVLLVALFGHKYIIHETTIFYMRTHLILLNNINIYNINYVFSLKIFSRWWWKNIRRMWVGTRGSSYIRIQ